MTDEAETASVTLSQKPLLRLRVLALALFILLLAFAVRIHLLGSQSLWNDEGNSYVQATRTLAAIADNAARDIHPPGYYWLLHGWLIASGDSEFSLRALSAFASVLTVAFTFALGRWLYGPVAGLAAALFLALNTFSIFYAQEARMYALLALWGVMGFWALVGFVTDESHVGAHRHTILQWPLLLAIINAAGLWTQYAYPFMMLAQGVVFVVWWVGHIRARGAKQASPLQRIGLYVVANGLTLLLYLPWLPAAWSQITTWPSTGEAIPLRQAVSTILGWFTLGVTYTVVDPSWIAVGLFLLLFGLFVQRPVRDLWRVLLPVAWVVLPVGLFLGLGLFRPSNLKFLLPAGVGFALWLGRGVWVLWHLRSSRGGRVTDSPLRYLPLAVALVVILALGANLWRGLDPLYHHPDFHRADYRGIAADISANLRAGDAVILDAPNQEEVFRYYYAAAAPVYPLPPGLGGDDAATRRQVEELIADHDRLFVVFWGEAERDPNRVVETTLDSQAFEAADQWYGDVRLVRYSTPKPMSIEHELNALFGDSITLESYALSSDVVAPGDVLQLRLDWRTDAPLAKRYKVFVQLLDSEGQLVAQRDSEPGGGLALTTTWPVDGAITDNHALIIPNDLPPAHYALIIGLYDSDDPQQRLKTGDADHLILSDIHIP